MPSIATDAVTAARAMRSLRFIPYPVSLSPDALTTLRLWKLFQPSAADTSHRLTSGCALTSAMPVLRTARASVPGTENRR